MNKYRATQYAVYDEQGNEIVRGNKTRVALKMGYSESYIYNCFKNKQKLGGIYTVKRRVAKSYVYQLKKDGKVVYEGSASDVAEKFNVRLRSVYQNYYNGYKLCGYDLDRTVKV